MTPITRAIQTAFLRSGGASKTIQNSFLGTRAASLMLPSDSHQTSLEVKYRQLSTSFSTTPDAISSVIRCCLLKNPSPLLTTQVVIKPYEEEFNFFHSQAVKEQLKDYTLINYWLSLSRSPIEFLSLLKPLDAALGKKMEKKGLVITQEERPEELLQTYRYWLPGPSPIASQKVENIDTLIDEVLLAIEQKQGINQKGTPVFIGLVQEEAANALVASGHVFEDYDQVSRLVLHGRYSHRLFVQGLIHSLSGTKWEEKMSPRELLTFLIDPTILGRYFDTSLWVFLADNITDHVRSFNYSCRSPFVLQSLIMCFGEQLGVPHLSYCIRKSFWNSVDAMVKRVKEGSKEQSLNREEVYRQVLEHLLCSWSPGDVTKHYSFVLPAEEARLDPKYIQYPGTTDPGIKMRKRP